MNHASDQPHTIFHVGLPKTGSTFLQHVLFPSIPGVKFLGVHTEGPTSAFLAELQAPADDFDMARLEAEWQNVLDEHADESTILISRERLSGVREKVEFASRIDHVTDRVSIVLLLRNPFDLVESAYLQLARGFSHKRDSVSFDHFIRHEFHEMGYVDRIRVHDLVRTYEDVVGRDNVYVYLYEDMRDDWEGFAHRMIGDLGLEAENWSVPQNRRVNVRMSRRQQMVLGLLGRSPTLRGLRSVAKTVLPAVAQRAVVGLLSRGGGAQVEWTGEQRRTVIDICAEQNRRLQEERGLPLAERGYPTGKAFS